MLLLSFLLLLLFFLLIFNIVIVDVVVAGRNKRASFDFVNLNWEVWFNIIYTSLGKSGPLLVYFQFFKFHFFDYFGRNKIAHKNKKKNREKKEKCYAFLNQIG